MHDSLFRIRIGLGHDTHRLGSGGPWRLGGVDIPHDQHCIGHSDADILLHAITDGLLGAAGAGDIGSLFPNTDEVNRGRDSGQMLQLAWHPLAAGGWRLLNMDCVVFAQEPKLAPYWPAIRQRVAALLSGPNQVVSEGQISLKAKTGEHVGYVGRKEAVSAQCSVLLLAPEAQAPEAQAPEAQGRESQEGN